MLLSALLLVAWKPFAYSQTFPAQATGIFTLQDGNELRILQTLPSTKIQGIIATPKRVKLADFSGTYDKETGKILAKMSFCDGGREKLTFFFTRNNANAAEIYFGEAPNDRKETGKRKGNTRPTLAYECAPQSTLQTNEPFLGKGSWTGTWKTDHGIIRLVQVNDVVTGKVNVIGDFKDTGVIQLIDFEGNEVEGEFTSQTQLDGYFKITRISETKFEGTYRWGRQIEWTPWGGERTSSQVPELTATGAQHFLNRLLTD